MPENAIEFTTYATKYTKEAIATRKKFPHAIQVALLDVIDKLTEDPQAHPERCKKSRRGGKYCEYIHPDPHIEVTYEVDQESKIIYFLHFAAPEMQLPRLLFISYSHEDQRWLDHLKKWLKPLEQDETVSIWDDTRIKPGTQWKEEIERSIANAKVALLLVSQNFLSSDFISNNELPQLLDAAKLKGVSVFWLALSSSTVQDTKIASYQALHDFKQPLDTLRPGKRNKIFTEVYEKIRNSLETIH